MSSCWAWLTAGLSGAVHVAPNPWIYWHARFMVAGWGVLLPLGILVARYFKVTPRQDWPRELDNVFWWRTHVRLQTAGVLIMTLGVMAVWSRADGTGGLKGLHHLLGWTLITIGWLQIAGGLLRGSKGGPTGSTMRGDHFDMTRRRILFEYVHKSLGWIAMLGVIVETAAGLIIVDAPRWMAAVLTGWWLTLLMALVVLQRAGRCIDTYQAIWGRDPALPGNRRQPIGRGIVRHGLDQSGDKAAFHSMKFGATDDIA